MAMVETQSSSSKRQRDEEPTHLEDFEDPKRQKPEYQTTVDTSEGYNSSSSGSSSPSSSPPFLKENEQEKESVERVMRHLLEASDDELGIPHREVGNGFEDAEEEGFSTFGDNGLSLCDGLWELEDEAANYYTLVQSELFM
ncbi:hypothetical protein M0R45_022284 [Rubus argutus]|uniref:Uncharacterized protein n=1 Tax=Rubus argutus TaxID=59490 RepID=A0AAW1XEU0_RUBAR